MKIKIIYEKNDKTLLSEREEFRMDLLSKFPRISALDVYVETSQ